MRVLRLQDIGTGDDVHLRDHRVRRYLREHGQTVGGHRRRLHLRWNRRGDFQSDELPNTSRENNAIDGGDIEMCRRSLRVYKYAEQSEMGKIFI